MYTIKALKALGAGLYHDGQGLYIQKQSQSVGQWHYRYTMGGRTRKMGLGGWPLVSLSEARELAHEARVLVKRHKIDPIEHKKRDSLEPTLNNAVLSAYEARQAVLKGTAWYPAYQLHVSHIIGSMRVSEVDQRHLKKALAPLWRDKHQTARKCMQALRAGLNHSKAEGHNVDLGILDAVKVLLGDSGHITKNFASMPWQDVPAFYKKLTNQTATERIMMLLLLTGGGAGRTAPLRFMEFDQVKGDVWTIPSENMKGRKGATSDFRIPLARPAMELLSYCRSVEKGPLVFTNRSGGVLSDNATGKYMRDRAIPYTPHGFRASFRDWMAYQGVPFEIAETAIAHKVGGRVTQAYLRTDHLDARRTIHNNWAEFLHDKKRGNSFTPEIRH